MPMPHPAKLFSQFSLMGIWSPGGGGRNSNVLALRQKKSDSHYEFPHSVGIEDRNADYLLEHLKSSNSQAALKCVHERSVIVYKNSPARQLTMLNCDPR